MLDKLTSADFSQHLHQLFHLPVEGADPIKLELATVTELGAPLLDQRAPFSLVFRGPKQLALPQRIYHLEHAEMGALEIFLVPIGPDETGMRYEAIFT